MFLCHRTASLEDAVESFTLSLPWERWENYFAHSGSSSGIKLSYCSLEVCVANVSEQCPLSAMYDLTVPAATPFEVQVAE